MLLLNELLDTNRHDTFLTVRSVVGHDDHLIRRLAHLVLEDDKIPPESYRMPSIRHNMVLDLSTDGDRWEGDVVGEWPLGFGELYNENDQLVYRGFMYKMHRICYGTSYYEDMGIMRIKYEGMYMWDKRFGKGSMYNRKGQLEYEGEWINDQPCFFQTESICSSMDLENLSSVTEIVMIGRSLTSNYCHH